MKSQRNDKRPESSQNRAGSGAIQVGFRFPAAATALMLLLSVGAFPEQALGAESTVYKSATGFSTNWDTLPVTVERLSPSLHYLHGSGGNMVLSSGSDGLVLVDNEFVPLSDRILETIAAIAPGSVRLVLNTHWHGDHTGMNAGLAALGATVIAQDRSRARMLDRQYSVFFDAVSQPAPKAALPVLTFPDRINLHLNGESVSFFAVPPSHTDGDAVVWFPESNVVHLGDVYIHGLYPIIDVAGGGDVNGYEPAINQVLALIDDDTRVIPGHGPPGTRADLVAFRDMIVSIRDRVRDLLQQGLDIDGILAARPSREFDARWASDRVGPDDMVMMVYQSLSGDYRRALNDRATE